MANKIQLRRDTAQNWTNNNPTLSNGEPGVETDTNKFKIGNGTDAWNNLPYGVEVSGAGDMLKSTYDPQDINDDVFARANHTGTQPSTTITNAINVNNSQGGSITLDLDIRSEYWNLTSNLIISDSLSNPPENGFSKTKNIKITTANGTETVILPAAWDIYGTFDPTKKNKLSIEISQISPFVFDVDVFINQPN